MAVALYKGMKTSKFNIVIPMDTEGDYKIYNTLYKTHAIVDEEAKLLLENLNTFNSHLPPFYKGGFRGDLTDEAKTVISQLREFNIILDDDMDEDLELEYSFQKDKFNNTTLDINILTTYACNLKCVYCSQDGIESSGMMDIKTCHKVAAWLGERMEKVRPRFLRVTFYGGEPLLNKEAVRLLSKLIFLSATQRKIFTEISIITNGTLLDEDLITELKPWGLRGVRVTLDGDESAHDSKRCFRNGSGTFDLILKNLEKIKGIVPIYLNGNFDDNTKKKIPALLDTLADRGFRGHIGAITFKPILKNIESAAGVSSNCSEICTFCDIPDINDMYYLIRETEKRGFKSGMGTALGPCEASREYTYTVDPSGKIYKCAGFVGRKEFVIGDLNSEDFNYRLSEFMTTDSWRSDCSECHYLPLCGGGCRVSAYLKHGDHQKVACDKGYFSNVSQRLIKAA